MLTIEKVIVLKSVNLFSEIPENELLSLAMELEVVEFEKNSIVMKQGEFGTSMYVVIKGEVGVEVNGKQITKLGEKAIFGELAVLDPEPRSATVVTLNDTIVFKLESDSIYNLISQNANVARGIMKILCQRIRSSNE